MTDTDFPRPRPRRRLPRPIRAAADIARDLTMASLTLALGVISVVTPRSLHKPVVRAVAAVSGRNPYNRLAVEHSFCRGYGVFRRGWPAKTRVTGLEHFEKAQAERRGVVMWVMGFMDQTALNLALADAGHPVTFLSAQNHAVYSSRAVSRWLARPVLIRGVSRSLERIVVIPDDGNKSYVRDLVRVLDRQGTVGIKGDVTDQRGAVEAPFGGRTARFPTGAPSLAHLSGAPLVTGAVVRHGPLDHEVIIDEPIDVPRTLKRDEYIQRVIEEFAGRLESRARAHPDSRPATKFDKITGS